MRGQDALSARFPNPEPPPSLPHPLAIFPIMHYHVRRKDSMDMAITPIVHVM